MKEYFGESSKKYGLTKGKRFLLMPGIERALAACGGKTLLDVACGNGDLAPRARAHGYTYYGVDISADLLTRAKEEHAEGVYLEADARHFAHHYNERFDIVVISMLFPALDAYGDMVSVLGESKAALTDEGRIVVAVTHPSFDHYMQHFLFARTDVHTDFKGYFASGTAFEMDQIINGESFRFEDFHWTFADYVRAFRAAGLSIESVDECPCDVESLSPEDMAWGEKRNTFPTYLVFTLGRG